MMNISQQNLTRIKKTVFNAPDKIENGLYGDKLFALIRCVRMFGEPIDCADDSNLHGLLALEVANGEYVAIKRNIFKNGCSICQFYWLENTTVS